MRLSKTSRRLHHTGYTRDEIIGRTTRELNLWNNPDDHDRLLEQLARDGAVRGRVKIDGPGLSIARQIVEKMGGQVGVDNAPGGGRFWFPCRPPHSQTRFDNTLSILSGFA